MSDIKCPYCGHEQEINHDDGYGYDEDETHQQECCNCEKTFTFTTSISYFYEAFKAPCLNGSDHRFEPTVTVPKYWTKMRCEWCGEERAMTEEERAEYNIPPIPDRFKRGA